MLKGKNIVVGITGGIAAYKSAEIVSRLKKKGANVYCVMTQNAQEFISPLTLRTLSNNPVVTSMFEEPGTWEVEHISLADKADLFLIAPATANIIGKVAHGIADDFLSTTLMATRGKVLFAPAMNIHMYENKIVQENITRLKARGYDFIDPVIGNLACGYTGKGKMAEPEAIVARVCQELLEEQILAGHKILITAGPTKEKIDPVRYLTNHSSGKMGYALAEVAARKGAQVTLISGPTNLKCSPQVNLIKIESALDMFQAVQENLDQNEIVIMAAAVADYWPKIFSEKKIKKKDEDLKIVLERNPDILKYIGENKKDKILVGFAAETNDLKENATKKIIQKNLDFIVANDITQAGAGFAVDTNQVTLFFADGSYKALPLMDKYEVANKILTEVYALLKEKRSERND